MNTALNSIKLMKIFKVTILSLNTRNKLGGQIYLETVVAHAGLFKQILLKQTGLFG